MSCRENEVSERQRERGHVEKRGGRLGSNNESESGKRSNGCATDYAHSECSRQLGHCKDKNVEA